MSQQDPAVQVEYVAVFHPGPGKLLEWASDGSQWVDCNFVIHVRHENNTHFVTIFPTPEGEVSITVPLYTNGSDFLDRFRDEIFAQPPTTYHKIFQPYTYRRKWTMFHRSEVGV